MEAYQIALSRTDLSRWLVHLTTEKDNIKPFEILRNILKMGIVLASHAPYITCYNPAGATCFYEVPPKNWQELINTNPNKRRGYGLIVLKDVFWHLEGRPAIYTENPTDDDWPEKEKYRLVRTELDRSQPIDWMHEREWRLNGDFNFRKFYSGIPYEFWWWPCVENIKEAQLIFREDNLIKVIYVMEIGKVLERNEIFF